MQNAGILRVVNLGNCVACPRYPGTCSHKNCHEFAKFVAVLDAEIQYNGCNFLIADPLCDPPRSHPRYHALLRKMNLEA
jgi:hypothetical protein